MSEPATDTQIDQYEWEAKRSMWLMPERALALIARLRAEQATSTPPPSALVEGGERRPPNCRFRLQDEGKGYPRSSCAACGKTITTGLGKGCTFATPPSRNDTIRECISVADNNYYEKLSAANRWFEQGDQGSAIVCRDQARACRDISTALRALLTDEVKP